jgi:hypothetical protein
VSVGPHTHQDLEDRITAEMTLVRTDIASLKAQGDVLRQEMRRGFTHIGQVLDQILGRLPDEQPEGGGDDG